MKTGVSIHCFSTMTRASHTASCRPGAQAEFWYRAGSAATMNPLPKSSFEPRYIVTLVVPTTAPVGDAVLSR